MGQHEHPHSEDGAAPSSLTNRSSDHELNSLNEKSRQSLHSNRKPTRFGRHSIDADRRADGPLQTERARTHSLTALDDATQLPRSPLPTHAPTGANTRRQRTVRSSTEFDRRFDGPFARPSLAMTRRLSSQQPRPSEHSIGGVLDNPDVAADTESAPRLLEPEPPPLNYTLHTRYRSIFIFWLFIVIDSVAMPIGLYYGLWYGVGPGSVADDDKEIMSANTVYSIVTAAIGGASILEYFVRFWRLFKKGSTCRVIGARRWYLDAFHWNYTLAWLIVMVELIV